MLDPNTTLTVTLRAAEWNAIMAQLAEGPYRLVAPLLASIQRQCQGQDADAPGAELRGGKVPL
jgi:hypothetical protein